MQFTVRVKSGDVFINGEFVSQLCFDGDSVGYAVAAWLNNSDHEDEELTEWGQWHD